MAEKTVAPVLTYTAHSAPLQMVFYTGRQFPREYRNNAFVAMRGSWNRQPPSGYEVVRIHFENRSLRGSNCSRGGFCSRKTGSGSSSQGWRD